nr:ATP-binding cassette domain-containing protein [Tessaracoccus coleopterorum]
MTLLEVTDLTVRFGKNRPAVDGISFSLGNHDRLGIIGQSGSGKSVTSLAILGLLPEHAQVTGSIRFMGRELVGLPKGSTAACAATRSRWCSRNR